MHEATAGYEATLTVEVMRAFEAFVEDLSNWYIRRSRPRFWQEDADAFRTLWYALVQSLRAVAPVMPFLTEHLWLNLVPGGAGVDPPRRLARACPSPTAPLLDEMALVRRVVTLAHRARATSGLKVRQPLRRLVVAGAGGAAGALGRDRRRAAREGGRVRHGRGVGAAREAEPAGARAEARQGARRGARRRSRRASSRSSTAAASG